VIWCVPRDGSWTVDGVYCVSGEQRIELYSATLGYMSFLNHAIKYLNRGN
jgi:hypothetical protein